MEDYKRAAARRYALLNSGTVAFALHCNRRVEHVQLRPKQTVQDLQSAASESFKLKPETVKLIGLDSRRLPSPDAPILSFLIVRRWIEKFVAEDAPEDSTQPMQRGIPTLKPIKLTVIGTSLQPETVTPEPEAEEVGEVDDEDDEELKAAIALSLQEAKAENHEPQNEADDAGEERKCRICLGGPEDGPMFSPCLCRGSMQMVHVACLNQWRRSSANPRSYYECEQCRFRYQLRRAWFAEILMNGRFLVVMTITTILLMMAAAAAISHPLLKIIDVDLAEITYRECNWKPWWLLESEYPTLASYRPGFDFLISGLLILGSIGFLDWAYCQYLMHRHTADGWRALLWTGFCLFGGTSSFRSRRMVLLIGIFFTIRHLYGMMKERCAFVVQRWGEAILEVRS